jgi:hypothetical protein
METTTTTVTTTVNNGFFNSIGIGGLDIGILFLVLIVLMITLIVLLILSLKKQKQLRERYELFMQGSKASSFEDQVQTLIKDVDRLKKDSRAYANDIDLLFSKHEGAIQKVGLVRYDAFSMGGNMSFCFVLLDEKNNGTVMNCVHSSDGCYTYMKRVKEGKCNIDLSPEEQEAIRRAVNLTED